MGFSDIKPWLLCLAISLQGCALSPPLPDDIDEPAEQSRTSPEPAPFPSFSTAMTRLQPLATIAGNESDSDTPSLDEEKTFEGAIAYAKAMDSFALLISHKGELLVEKYFGEFDKSLRPESASMHKSVVGLLIAAALSDGLIDEVDTPIKNYTPEWRDDPRGDIRLLDLLTMSSGLENLSFIGGPSSPAMRYVVEGENARATTLGLTLGTEPGSKFQYSNAVTQLLVIVLEAATGKPYHEYLSERLWRPIGALDAYVWLNEADGFARGYTTLLARARDWLKVGQLIKNKGRVNGEQIIDENILSNATAPSRLNSNYGWQIWRGGEYQKKRYYNTEKTGIAVSTSAPYLVDDLLFFDGFGGQRVYISRKKDLVIIRLGEVRFDWDDSVIPNLVIEALNE